MMLKRKHLRKWQRIMIGIAIIIALILLLPFAKKMPLGYFFHNHSLFSIPDAPKFSYTKQSSKKDLVDYFYWKVESNDPALLLKLQQARFPATMQDKTILVGPYLKEFNAEAIKEQIQVLTPAKVERFKELT